jgi:hypothetical protein
MCTCRERGFAALLIPEIHAVAHLHTAVVAPAELHRAYARVDREVASLRTAVGVCSARWAAKNLTDPGAGFDV